MCIGVPDHRPQNDTADPHPLPTKVSDDALLQAAIRQVISIATNPVFGDDTCTRCQASLEVAKFLALAAPEQGPALAVALCVYFDFDSDCYTEYSVFTLGAVVTQVVGNADVGHQPTCAAIPLFN